MSKQKWNMEGGGQDGGMFANCTTQEIGSWEQWQHHTIFVRLLQGPRESGQTSNRTAVLGSAAQLISDARTVQSFRGRNHLGRSAAIVRFFQGCFMKQISRAGRRWSFFALHPKSCLRHLQIQVVESVCQANEDAAICDISRNQVVLEIHVISK